MIRFSASLVLLIATVLIMQSCDKKDQDCAFIAPDVVFVNFTPDESDTLIIRRYEKDNQFNTLLDTFLITKANIIREPVGKDSVKLTSATYTKLRTELFANNWEIYLPGVSRTYRISDVAATFTQEHEPSTTCQSFANTVNVDGQTFNYTSWFDVPYRIYLVK